MSYYSFVQNTFIRGMLSAVLPGSSLGNLNILMLHKIPVAFDPLVPDELCMPEFETILDFLQSAVRVLPLREAVQRLRAGTLPSRAVAITFDDGYAEWTRNVAAALRKRSMPATFFVTTEILAGVPLWHERIVSAVRALPITGARLPFGFSTYTDLSDNRVKAALIKELQTRLKYLPLKERLEVVTTLEAQVTRAMDLPAPFRAADVRELHSQGFEIGGHSIRHPILNECTDADANTEIGGGKEELESIIGGKVDFFAYPNGRPGLDYQTKHVDMVKAAGYIGAVSTSGGVARQESDFYQLPRTAPWGSSKLRMAHQLMRNKFTRSYMTVPFEARDHAKAVNQRPPTDVRCLLISSTFSPIHGGSAVVYDNLCAHMPPGSIRVLTARKNYLTNQEIEGWQAHDRAAPYPIDRFSLLRPLMPRPSNSVFVSLYRFAFNDLVLYAKLVHRTAMLIRKHRINIICIGDLVTGSWLGFAMRRLCGCKVIIYVHGEEITTATGGRLHGNRRAKNLLNADKIVAVSQFTCDAMTNQMDVQPRSLALLQNGVDTDRFTPGPADPALLARHGLSGKRIVLTIGRLVPRKGIDMSIRAMRLVVQEMPDVHHLVVGEGDYRKELERIIAQEQMSAHVTLVGKTSDEDLLGYLRSCDVFLMPNRTMPDGDTEGFGLVFREANACRKPVIGGRAGGAVEAVVDGETGLLVDGNSPQEIADALLRVLRDPALAERFAANGLQLALRNNVKMVSERFLKICERVLMNAEVK